VEVISVKQKTLPDLDDEFAKGVGDGFDDLEALRSHVKERLEQESESEATRKLEQESLDELVKVSTVQASDLLYQREVEMMQQERERSLQNQRIPMEAYLSYIGQTAEEFQEQMRPSAEERLTRYLVMRRLAEEENLSVDSEEVQAEIDTMVSTSGESEDAMRRALSSQNALDNLHSSLINRKVMERLLEIVQGEDSSSGSGSVPNVDSVDGDTENDSEESN
jgi:trigger factor